MYLRTKKSSSHVTMTTTPSCKSVSDFRLVPSMPLCQGSCMDPIWPETEVGKILGVRPPEIGVQVTPGMSHGTKIFGSKIFSYHPQMMLFYAFWGFVMQKMLKIMKNCSFLHKCLVRGCPEMTSLWVYLIRLTPPLPPITFRHFLADSPPPPSM